MEIAIDNIVNGNFTAVPNIELYQVIMRINHRANIRVYVSSMGLSYCVVVQG